MKTREQKLLVVFLGLHFVLWFLVGLIRSSIPMDTAEAIVWGGEWTFITNKHPYLSGWFGELAFSLFGNARVTAAVLAAGCSTAALWFVYRLARQFLDRSRSVLSALVLEGCVYYSVCALEYNCNVLSAALAPLFFWMAWRALKTGAGRHWIATGLLAGALLMTKYSNGALLMGVFVYVLICRRDVFRRPAAYLAVVLCLGICLPHLIALVRTDFETLGYLRGSAESAPGVWEHFRSPIWFLVAQLINAWGVAALIAFAVCTRRFDRRAVHPYLLCVGLLPILSFPCFAAVTATPLKDLWGFAFASAWPMIVLAGMEMQPKLQKWLVRPSFLVLGIQVCVLALVAVCHTSTRTWLDVDATIGELPVKDVPFIGGDIWLCSEVALSLERRPRVAIDMDPKKCPWISFDEMERRGFLVLTDDPSLFRAVYKKYPDLQGVRELSLPVKAPYGKKKLQIAYIGYYPPHPSAL